MTSAQKKFLKNNPNYVVPTKTTPNDYKKSTSKNKFIVDTIMNSKEFIAMIDEKMNKSDKKMKWFSAGFTFGEKGEIADVKVELEMFDTQDESRICRRSFQAEFEHNPKYIGSRNFGLHRGGEGKVITPEMMAVLERLAAKYGGEFTIL